LIFIKGKADEKQNNVKASITSTTVNKMRQNGSTDVLKSNSITKPLISRNSEVNIIKKEILKEDQVYA
jgi:hypothetical protein